MATFHASANLPTRYGTFRVYAFRSPSDDREHVALVKGTVRGKEGVTVRVHSECLTGESFWSQRCDCRGQLDRAMRMIGRAGHGVLVYLAQEGRGIGIMNKIRAYRLQDAGMDTVEANLALGFMADERDFRPAAEILKMLGVKSVKLITNNPAKIHALKKYGIPVVKRLVSKVPPTKYSASYLQTKKKKFGHLL